MIQERVLYDFDDLLIQPNVHTVIKSRTECNPYDLFEMLPLITAPMDTVVSINNVEEFKKNKINIALTRGENKIDYSTDPMCFYSYGLKEFKELFINRTVPVDERKYALIDVANGHMYDIYKTAELAKNKFGDELCLMVGNIANPETFGRLLKAGVDYVRVGIGNGGGCLTTQQTGIGYPMGSLINECSELKERFCSSTGIVADGGMKKYSDIIKALALGADYVMAGSIFNKALESAGENYVRWRGDDNYMLYLDYYNMVLKKPDSIAFRGMDISLEGLMKQGILYKKYQGMSSKEVQAKWGRTPKTSEGITKHQKVEYTLEGWVENFEHYLRSAMSYTNSSDLKEFKKATLNLVSQNAFNRYNK